MECAGIWTRHTLFCISNQLSLFQTTMTTIIRNITLVLMLLAAPLLHATAENTLVLGNCRSNVATYLPVSATDTAGAVLFYPQTTMQAYKGCQITEFSIAFNNKTTGGAVTLFLSHGIHEAPFYTQTADAKKNGWNTFRLTTPYDIDGRAVYIGYKVAGMRYLNYSTKLVDNEEWIWQKADGWTRYDGKYSASLYATVSGSSLPQHNVRLGAVQMPRYYRLRETTPMSAVFQNLGAQTVSSLEVAYLVDGTAVQTETVTGLSVAPRTEGTVNLLGYAFSREGHAQLALGITAVNGGNDAVTDDNTSAAADVLCRKNFTKRKALLEFFSTELCTSCPQAHEEISTVLADRTDVVELGHHAGFYTDTLTLEASTAYEWFYNPVHLYAPAMMIDRTNLSASYPAVFNYGVPVIDATGAYASLFTGVAAAVPALVSLDIQPKLDGRNLTVTVGGTQLLPVATPDSVRLYVFLTEDSIHTFKQAGASHGFYHRHAARRCLSATWGDPIDIAAGFSREYHTTLDKDWNTDRMRAVAFVANYNANDKNDCVVLNTEAAAITGQTASVSLPKAHTPAPSWTLRTLSGTVVASGTGQKLEESILHPLPHGIYLFTSGSRTRKIIR